MIDKNKPVLVTGATGFLGAHIIAELSRRSYSVRGTLRNAARGSAITEAVQRYTGTPLTIEFVETDLTSDANWDAAVEGIGAIHHVASPVPLEEPENPDDVIVPAREGTLRVLRAAKQADVRRVVLTSSTAAIVYGHEGSVSRPFTEDDWTNPSGKDTYPYVLSKFYAEKAAWSFAREHDIALSTINPGLILGPVLERDYGSSAEAVRKLMAGEFPGSPKIGWPIVDVRDVARLHVDSLENESAIGERFLATSGYLWISEIAEILKTEFPDYKKQLPSIGLPNWFVRLFALFDKETKSILPELGIQKTADSGKAQKTFDWQPIPVRDAVIATAESLREYDIV